MNTFGLSIIKKYVVFFVCIYAVPVNATFQYIDEYGCIKGKLADIMGVLKIDLSRYQDANDQKKPLPVNYVSHAYNFLKLFYQDGNYQGRQAFYQKGGKPDYQLSREQARQVLYVLRGRFALHKSQDPQEKKTADVVICTGADWSIEKRIFSFEKFLEAGFNCDNVFFLSRTFEHDQNVKRAIEKHRTLFNGKNLHPLYVPYQKDSMTHENLIEALKPLISKEFYLISDPEYAEVLLEAFTVYGKKHGLTCLGAFVRPITSEPDDYIRKDFAGYKLDEFMPNKDDQTLAAAYMSLGLLGYQVMQEIKLYSPGSTFRTDV